MKALAPLIACLALGVSTPSHARFAGGGPHGVAPHGVRPYGVPPRPGPITRPGIPQTVYGQGSGWRPHGWSYGGGDFGTGFSDGYAAPASEQTADAPPLLLPPVIPPAPQCQVAAPSVIEETGPRIIYIGHTPATPANLPKVIYGTD